MKSIFVALLFPITLFAQGLGGDGNWRANEAQLFKTYTNFTATSDDTTGYVSLIDDPLIKTQVMLAHTVKLIWYSTDSVNADVYVIGRNKILPLLTSTYSDSIIPGNNPTAAAPYTKVITLKAFGTDRLSGCTEFKVGTVFRATLQGTTSGRTGKWYLYWVK